MTILFAGGEMGAFIPSDSNVIEAATSGTYNPAFARCATRIQGSAAYAEANWGTALDTFFLHFEYRGDGTGTTGVIAVLNDNGGSDVFRINAASSTSISLTRWNGASWVAVGSSASVDLGTGSPQVIDLYYDSAGGTVSLYIAGTLRIGPVAAAVDDDITKVRFPGISTVLNSYISQVVVSTTSTIGGRLFTVPISGAGSDSAWTGTYANVDEVAYSDADFINSAVNAQVSTFAGTAPTLTGYQVLAVAVTARAKRGASGPANLQLALRSSGTNYFSGNKALDVGYSAYQNIWETDPATTAAWVNAAVSSLQHGVKSIT